MTKHYRDLGKGHERGGGRHDGRPTDDPDAPFIVGRAGSPGLGDELQQQGAGPRVLRLERLLFEELDRLFRLEVSDPRLDDLTIARVQLSPDLRNAKVYYARRDTLIKPAASKPAASKPATSKPATTKPATTKPATAKASAARPAAPLTPGAQRALEQSVQRGITEALGRVTPFLRARLAEVVLVKRLPDLHFHRDRDAEAALRASQITVASPATSGAVASTNDAPQGTASVGEAAPSAPS